MNKFEIIKRSLILSLIVQEIFIQRKADSYSERNLHWQFCWKCKTKMKRNLNTTDHKYTSFHSNY